MDQSCIVPIRRYGNLGTLVLQLQGCTCAYVDLKGGLTAFIDGSCPRFLASDSLGRAFLSGKENEHRPGERAGPGTTTAQDLITTSELGANTA